MDDGTTNYLLSSHTIEVDFRSVDYIKLLKDKVLPIIMLNFGKDFYLFYLTIEIEVILVLFIHLLDQKLFPFGFSLIA